MTDAHLKQFEAIISAMPEAALLVDEAGIIILANKQAEKAFSARLNRQPISLFIRSPSMSAALAKTFASSHPVEFEYEERAAVQRLIFAHVARLGEDSVGKMALVLLRDRTREAQVEKMRSDFVANASHELRTPLTTLLGFIDTMQGAAKQDEKAQAAFLPVMKAQAERMNQLIDDLLSLSRIELNEHVDPTEVVDLGQVLRQVENLLRPMSLETGCELEVNAEQNVVVRGDANQLGQVAHNLIENAIKYSGKGKHVTASVSKHGGEATLSVYDNGPGIAAHHIPRLTERFYRVNVQESRTRGGTGLGLAICKHIVNRHRGRLTIASEVGKGSAFHVSLPVTPVH